MNESRKPGPEEQWQRILGRCNERVGHLEALCRVASEALVAIGGPPSVIDALTAAAEGGAFTQEEIDALRLTAAREAEVHLQRHARDEQLAAQQAMAIERLTGSLAGEVDRRVQAEVETGRAQAKAERANAYANHWRMRGAQAEQARTAALQALRDLVQEITRRLPGATRTSMYRKAQAVLDGNPTPAASEGEALALLVEAVSGKVEAWDEWFRRADRIVEASQSRAGADDRVDAHAAAPGTAAALNANAPTAVPAPSAAPDLSAATPTPEEFAAAARAAEFDQHFRIEDASHAGQDPDRAQPVGASGQHASGGKPAGR